MSYEKPSKQNVLVNLWQNVKDSQNGVNIMIRESKTVSRIYPMMIVGAIVLGGLTRLIDRGWIGLEWVILIGLLVLNFITETMNSAVEETCDRITREFDLVIKRAKDLASAAVYLCHMTVVFAILFFTICHAVGFEWWTRLVP